MALTNEQRELRRTGLGGSDAAAVVGLSPWKTQYQLYREKVEGLEIEGESEAMKWGSLVEPIIAGQFGALTGKPLRPGLDTVRHKDYPFLLANVDYYVEDESAILECKTASEWVADHWGEGDDHVPRYYLTQGLHYCAITGAERCYFAVLIGGNKLRTYTVKADPEAMDLIVQAEVLFWQNHVVPQVPPPMTNLELNKNWTKTTGQQVVASGALVDVAAALKALRVNVKLIEEQDSELSAIIKRAIADADELVHDGRKVASWKFNRPSQKFDVEKFKSEHPEMYSQYLREVAGARVLRLA